MNLKFILTLSIITLGLFYTDPVFSQEPEPPKIPEPSPEPKPIKLPEPEPIREPFPEESDAEKIQRLTNENEKLKEENLELKIRINELNEMVQQLQAITMEQIKVIIQLVEQLREVLFDGSSFSKIKI